MAQEFIEFFTKKGETVLDTIYTLQAMQVDIFEAPTRRSLNTIGASTKRKPAW